MKRVLLTVILFSTIYMTQAANPFFKKYNTPHETPPFDKISVSDYEPAFEEGMRRHRKEVDAIVNQRSLPTFENTIEALEFSGQLLDRVSNVFFVLLDAEGNDEMIEISERLSPRLTEHKNSINLNEKLFERVKFVYDRRNELGLTPEQMKLLVKTYEGMVKNGANLRDEAKESYRRLTAELSQLTLQFGHNVLRATNRFEMILTSPEELAGLPESLLDAAAQAAKNKGKEGYLFDLSYPSYVPFMKYSSRRDLREKMYRAYGGRCIGGEFDNIPVMKRIAEVRCEIARLMGKENFAEYALEFKMAKNSENVYNLLNQLLEAYKPTALQEVREVKGFAVGMEGKNIDFMPWDWSYYADKLQDAKYQLNDEILKPYFELDKVKAGVFGLATRLYGITFKKNPAIPVYHPEVEAFEVFDADNEYLGVLFTDFHPREGKRSGAWMTDFKGQWKENGRDSRPHIAIVMNFTRPTEDKPALLTYDEVETFLHEFGHSLHGMLTRCTYPSLSGTNVYWDFVELPSQLMENFLPQKEFLDTFAEHYLTHEKIPAELIDNIVAAQQYNAAYYCLRQLAFGLLDMAWYTRTTPVEDAAAFERQAVAATQLLPSVENTLTSPQFNHIFAGGYAAGYYGYKWAEVLDADAFSMFIQNGIFDRTTATSFRENILEKGGTEDPMTLYTRFRGQEPTIDALMRRDGIIK
ncbi:MAG: M3 family metallopeptidase [Coprobacter sp.]|nr:M3 family metallopeptidase [Coprobacter sp.]